MLYVLILIDYICNTGCYNKSARTVRDVFLHRQRYKVKIFSKTIFCASNKILFDGKELSILNLNLIYATLEWRVASLVISFFLLKIVKFYYTNKSLRHYCFFFLPTLVREKCAPARSDRDFITPYTLKILS